MKRLLLVLLLMPTAALAAEKDVVVTNTVATDVLTLPDDSLTFGADYLQVNMICHLTPLNDNCDDQRNPQSMGDKLVHSATLSLLADPGSRCEAELSLVDIRDNGFSLQQVLTVYANENAPGGLTISYPRPIRMEGRDFLILRVRNLDNLNGGCLGVASMGVEIP